MTVHARTHTDYKPFVCATCGYACNRKDQLSRCGRVDSKSAGALCLAPCFLPRSHSHSSPLPPPCVLLPPCHLHLRFMRAWMGLHVLSVGSGSPTTVVHMLTVDRHQQKHLGLRPFSCSVCGHSANRRFTIVKYVPGHAAQVGPRMQSRRTCVADVPRILP